MRRIPLLRETFRFLVLHTPYRRILSHPIARAIIMKFASPNCCLPKGIEPDAVLPTMSAYEVPGALLVPAFNAKWVHAGPPKRRWPGLLSACICAPVTRALPSPLISLEIEPTPVLLSKQRQESGGVAVLLAGDLAAAGGAAIRSALSGVMNKISQAHAMDWIIATSPRTSTSDEEYISSTLSQAINLREIYPFSKPGTPQTKDILSNADLIMVTEDSRTMISDAVATGRPVYILGAGPLNSQGDHQTLVDGLIRRRRVARLDVLNCKDFIPDPSYFKPLDVEREGWQGDWSGAWLEYSGPRLSGSRRARQDADLQAW